MKIKHLVFAAVLAAAVLSFGSGVQAQTTSELQAMIAQLQAQIQNLLSQIAALQAQQGGQTETWCHTFNTNLRIGDTGNEVEALITALKNNGLGDTLLYHGGSELPSVFTEQVASAVVAFQEKYASEILKPYGLTKGTGYVGASTRAKLNQLYGCKVACTMEAKLCPDGSYVGRTGPNCEFAACPATSVIINSVSGPVSLNVGQTGTWTINATAPSGSVLNYIAEWGDNSSLPSGYGIGLQQSASFTHSFSQAGTYTIKFTAADISVPCTGDKGPICGPAGSAQATITVVVGNTTQPSITVTSPNGGETWKSGTTYNITWNTNAIPTSSSFTLTLIDELNMGGSFNIACVPATQKSYSWSVPSDLSGNKYKIRVGYFTSGNNEIYDTSDNYFTIAGSNEGYFRNVYIVCYDGSASNMGDPTSCKPSSLWQTYADQFCQNKCSSVTGKCGVNTFSLSNPCTDSAQPSITASPTAGILTGASPTLWVDFVVSNYTPNGTELVDFGDGSKSALGYTTVLNSRHDYHQAGTYTVKLLSGTNVIATTQVAVSPAAQPSITVTSPNGGEAHKVSNGWLPFSFTFANIANGMIYEVDLIGPNNR